MLGLTRVIQHGGERQLLHDQCPPHRQQLVVQTKLNTAASFKRVICCNNVYCVYVCVWKHSAEKEKPRCHLEISHLCTGLGKAEEKTSLGLWVHTLLPADAAVGFFHWKRQKDHKWNGQRIHCHTFSTVTLNGSQMFPGRETRNFFHYNVIGFSTIKSYSKFTVMKSYVPWELLKQEILSGWWN